MLRAEPRLTGGAADRLGATVAAGAGGLLHGVGLGRAGGLVGLRISGAKGGKRGGGWMFPWPLGSVGSVGSVVRRSRCG